MPTENRSSNTEMVSMPPYIGLEPLVGLYYPAQCRRCGWVGSSEELTEDDAQCTRDIGDRLCLGDCDELRRDDLLGIIQAMAKAAQQHHGEPVAYQWRCKTVRAESQWRHWVECTEEDYQKTISAPFPTPRGVIREARKLYTHADPAEVERLREDLDECDGDRWKLRTERNHLSAQLAEAHALLREVHESGALYLEDHQPTAKTQALDERIAAALSASAEPSALPDPLGCNACSHADCGKFDGLRQVECRAIADNACARPGATS